MFIVLHIEKGTPFETADQGKFRYRTVWEQLDYGVQFSASRKFLTTAPIILYVSTFVSYMYTMNFSQLRFEGGWHQQS